MDARSYMRILRARWRMIVLITLVCVAAAGAVVATTTPLYQASTQVFVSTQGGGTSADLLSGNTFSEDRVQSYAKIATSPLVLQPVVTKLGLTMSAATLAHSVSASAPLNTVLINLSVSDTNAAQAARIANAVAAQFTIAVAHLEQPTTGGAAPVLVTITQPALTPAAPISPKVTLDLALGLLIGLALGVGAAVLRDTLDTTIRGDADLKEITDVPVIGGIVFDPDAAKRPLVVQSNPQGARAEAFRQLRTNLQFLNVADRPRSIVITSSIPGEGKSTTTANLALTLAAAGSKVVLVEGDLRRPRIADYLGLDNGAGLTNVLIGQAELDDVLQPWGNGQLTVLASGPKPPNPSELLGSTMMQKTLAQLTEQFDYVLIDAPPLLPFTDAAVLAKYTGATVALVGSGRTRKDQLQRSVESLASVDANLVGLVVNFVPLRASQAYGYTYGYQYAESYTKKRRRAEKAPPPPPSSASAAAGGSGKHVRNGAAEIPAVDEKWNALVEGHDAVANVEPSETAETLPASWYPNTHASPGVNLLKGEPVNSAPVTDAPPKRTSADIEPEQVGEEPATEPTARVLR